MADLEIERQGTIAVMAWNREEENSFSTPFCREIIDGLAKLAQDTQVTGVVITGRQEKCFSTGLDLEWIKANCVKDIDAMREFFATVAEMNRKVATFPKPLVAAINGHAAAMGCIVAAYMDYRLMREDYGYVLIPEVQIDIPFSPSMIAIFHEILPRASFRDMAYTGDRFTSLDAKKMGYIDKLCSKETLISESVALANKLGSVNLRSYATVKLSNRKRVIDAMENEDAAFLEFLSQKLSADFGDNG